MAREAFHPLQVRKLDIEQLYAMHTPGLVCLQNFQITSKPGWTNCSGCQEPVTKCL